MIDAEGSDEETEGLEEEEPQLIWHSDHTQLKLWQEGR